MIELIIKKDDRFKINDYKKEKLNNEEETQNQQEPIVDPDFIDENTPEGHYEHVVNI